MDSARVAANCVKMRSGPRSLRWFVIMRKIKIVLGVAVFFLAASAIWQVVGAYYANAELKEDLQDISADIATRMGLSQPASEDDLRRFVVEKAASHDIQLQPNQIDVKIEGEGKTAVISLVVNYNARINLMVYSFNLHFSASNAR